MTPLDQDPATLDRLEDEVLLLRVRREAKRIVDAEDRGEAEPFDAGLLSELTQRPPEPPYRIDGLVPSSSSTLIVAQRKTGKTTLTLNLARSLLLGTPFLGRFPTQAITGAVGMLNFEVSAQMIANWAAALVPAIPAERLFIVNVRGRRNPLGHLEDREVLAKTLREREIETLIVDPFGRAFTGTSQNDSSEVAAFLSQLDTFARNEAGAVDLVLTAHAGWEGERTRGSSALEDWPDSIITLTRDKNAQGQRYFRAEGRDVLVEEDRLSYDENTRTLSLTGMGSRRLLARVERLTDMVPAVVQAVTAQPGMSVAEVTKTLRQTSLTFQDADVRTALRSAADQCLIYTSDLGPGRRTEHFAVTPSNAVQTPSMNGVSATPSNPVQTPSVDALHNPVHPRIGTGVGVGWGSTPTPGRGRTPDPTAGMTAKRREIVARLGKQAVQS